MSNKTLKIIGTTTTIMGVVVTLVSNYVNDKNLDIKIESKVAEALAKNIEKTEL